MSKEADQPKGPDSQEQELPKISKEKLQKILAQHKSWVESEGKEGTRARLRGANLKEADLQEAELREADLQEADLREANLQKADLRGANLRAANLQEANLQEAILYKANLQKAILYKANLQEANLREANLQKVDLSEANLQEAELSEANLQEAELSEANLQEAILYKANLQEADLSKANLQEAVLSGANLQEASLAGAQLRGAILREVSLEETDLHDADLHETVLRDASLEDSRGLQIGQLSGADVNNAKLPAAFLQFEGPLSHIEDASKNARRFFSIVLLACSYAFLTILSTTDAALLTNAPSLLLPNVATAIPTVGFYVAGPLVILGLYIWFHFYMQHLWMDLSELPAVLPDGRPLDRTVYPWLPNGLVRAHFKLLREERRPLFSRFQTLIVIVLAWWLVPITLGLFWFRYLPRRDGWMWFQATLLLAAIAFATWFQLSARRTLRGQLREPVRFRWRRASEQAQQDGPVKAWGSFLYYFVRSTLPATVILALGLTLYELTPWVVAQRPADFIEADVSTKPANWTGKNTEDEIALVRGAQLRGKDLRDAEARGAFLVKADLFMANLQGADLSEANLQQADLYKANLQKADLRRANLQGAFLVGADLQGAVLWSTNLQGANLRGGIELTQEQLNSACGDAETKLPPGMFIKPCPEVSS